MASLFSPKCLSEDSRYSNFFTINDDEHSGLKIWQASGSKSWQGSELEIQQGDGVERWQVVENESES